MTRGEPCETDLQVRKANNMTEYFAVKFIVNIPLTNREWDHYREISDWGLDVLTEQKWGQYIKAIVWDFPVITEQMRLISYLLYGLFIMDLGLQSIKTNNWSADDFKKHVILMSCTIEPAIQLCDTGQQIPFLTAVNWP